MGKRPNVILIVMDAVRRDWLSLYGYPQPTSPHLADLAEDGIAFENAFATAPWTPPSHASLFTGLYPSGHGVDVNENLQLGRHHATLAETLRRNGYRTCGVVSDVHLSSLRGFHRGFQEFTEIWRIPYWHADYEWMKCLLRNACLGRDKRTYYASRVVRRWLARNRTGGPFFLFVNYKTAHSQYRPPWAFRKRFEVRRRDVNLAKARYYAKNGGYSYMAGRLDMSEAEFGLVSSWYRGAIAYLDATIGGLIRYLKETHLFDNTLLIVTADHGENFGEHNLAYHLFCLYDTLIRVPLLMTCPALLPRGRRPSGLVSLADIVPTVIDLLGLDAPAERVHGRSLMPFADGHGREAVFAEFGRPHYMLKRLQAQFPGHDFSRFDRGLQCIRTRDHKFIAASDGSEELYDLRIDPGETRNRVHEDHVVAADLRERLDQWRAAMRDGTEGGRDAGRTVEADEAVVKALRDLGYF